MNLTKISNNSIFTTYLQHSLPCQEMNINNSQFASKLAPNHSVSKPFVNTCAIDTLTGCGWSLLVFYLRVNFSLMKCRPISVCCLAKLKRIGKYLELIYHRNNFIGPSHFILSHQTPYKGLAAL